MSDLFPATRSPRLGDRLEAARRKNFVGRATELELFRLALQNPDPPFAVLYIYGPGGIGKSTLLREYGQMARESGRPVLLLDGRNINPTPEGFCQYLAAALGMNDSEAAGDTNALLYGLERFQPGVLLIDTYETLGPLDFWLRETLLPQLPGTCLVVIAGRNPPEPGWRTTPGWDSLLRAVALRNLRPEESRRYLSARGVPATHHDWVLGFTHGHPLALSLAGDMAIHEDSGGFRLTEHPQVLRLLLERFAQQAPSPNHRIALEICAQARVVSESLLAYVLEVEDAREYFQWIAGLSFMEHGPEGLFLHDLAREVLDAETRWRNPDAYARLHTRIREFILNRFMTAKQSEKQKIFAELLYLHRSSPVLGPFFDWKVTGTAYAEAARPEDHPAILEMVRHHEGEESLRIAQYWLEQQPGSFIIFRSADDPHRGFCANLVLNQPEDADLAADPAMRPAWEHVRLHGALRPGEHMLYHRFWCGRETHQDMAADQNLIAIVTTTMWMSDPKLAWCMIAIADEERYRPMFAYINLAFAPDAGFRVGEHSYGVFLHDWRAQPLIPWLDQMAERELNQGLRWEDLEANFSPPLVVLSQPDFEEAVRQALRDYPRPALLAGNPLLQSRLAAFRPGTSPIDALRALLLETVNALKGSPKDEKLHRALWVTYFEPAPTQEAAAERLDLPFSTYRYHLSAGLEKITAMLWQKELYGEG